MSNMSTNALLNYSQVMSKIQASSSRLTAEIHKIEAASIKMMQSSIAATNAIKKGYDVVIESIKRTRVEMDKLSKPVRLSIDCGGLRSSVQRCLESTSFKIKCECTGSSGGPSNSGGTGNFFSGNLFDYLGFALGDLGLIAAGGTAATIGTVIGGTALTMGTGYGLNKADEYMAGLGSTANSSWMLNKGIMGITNPFNMMFGQMQTGAQFYEDLFTGKNPIDNLIKGMKDNHGFGLSGIIQGLGIKLPDFKLPKINISAITGPIQLAIATVTGYWNRFRDLVGKGVQGAIKIVSGALSSAYKLAQKAYDYIRRGVSGALRIAYGTLSSAYKLAQKAYNYIERGARGVISVISSGIKGVWDTVSNLYSMVSRGAQGVVSIVYQLLGGPGAALPRGPTLDSSGAYGVRYESYGGSKKSISETLSCLSGNCVDLTLGQLTLAKAFGIPAEMVYTTWNGTPHVHGRIAGKDRDVANYALTGNWNAPPRGPFENEQKAVIKQEKHYHFEGANFYGDRDFKNKIRKVLDEEATFY